MKLQEIMIGDVVQISPADTIGEAAKLMREKFVGCLVATVSGVVKGIITDRDLLACLHQKHDPYQCKIAMHMSGPVIVLRPEEDHMTAINVMQEKRIKRLPVASRGKLQGIVSLSDLAAVAAPEVERIKSSGLFLSALIKTEGVQAQPSKPRARIESEKETNPKEELALVL
ncbi:MAG TPA: CBS domain-containing protein [Candidatus Binatia bacterium]|jgi:CBS domain-containing protein